MNAADVTAGVLSILDTLGIKNVTCIGIASQSTLYIVDWTGGMGNGLVEQSLRCNTSRCRSCMNQDNLCLAGSVSLVL